MTASNERQAHPVVPGMVSVLIPILNSAERLDKLLSSASAIKYGPIEFIINDDERSTDDAHKVVERHEESLDITYLRANENVGHGRLMAAKQARGEFLYFIDADMFWQSDVVSECVALCRAGADAVTVTEEQAFHNFWSHCKWLDKRVMVGVSQAESARFIVAERYWQVRGHNPRLMFAEDKDLDLRIRASGAHVARTAHAIVHDEGPLSARKQLKRAYFWSQFMAVTQRENPEAAAIPMGVGWRVGAYARSWRVMARHPALSLGLGVLHLCDIAGALVALSMRGRPNRVYSK